MTMQYTCINYLTYHDDLHTLVVNPAYIHVLCLLL